MMTTWVNKMKMKYEKKRNDKTEENKLKSSSSEKSIVQIRTNYYERYFESEKVPTPKSPKKDWLETYRQSDESLCSNPSLKPANSNSSNIDQEPSSVVNNENICIYIDPDSDSFYGSFRKRPKFHRSPNLKGTDKEIMMRLKAVENEFQNVQRYESILRPPLFQQVVVSKHQSELHNADKPKKSSIVSAMVEVFNQQAISATQEEKSIDLDLIESIRKDNSSLYTFEKPLKILQELEGNRNMKWVEMEQVRSKNLVNYMTKEEIRFQESQFEIISSEASYNRSLGVLVDKFYHAPQLSLLQTEDHTPVIKPYQKEHLFSNILKIYAVSSRFLADLEKRFSETTKIINLCDIVTKYAEKDFDVYVPYLQNQRFQSDAYTELKKDPNISKIIKELETQPECCFLNLDSFLFLPMQRLLRIRLLLKAVKDNIHGNRRHVQESVDKSILTIEKIIKRCSDNKSHIDERQRMLEICRHLDFKSGLRKVNISLGRLVHEGEVKRSSKNSSKSFLPDFLLFRDFWFIVTSEFLLMTKASKSKEISYLVDECYNVAELSVEKDSIVIGESLLQFKLVVRKSLKYFYTYVIQTKSKEDWSKWVSLFPEL